ncbi:hypothetical protein COOONC_16012 [Cooperia oncophora]
MVPSTSTTSMKTLVKKIRNGGRRLSAIAFRRGTPSRDLQTIEDNNDSISNISSCDCANVSLPISSPGHQTPPMYRGGSPPSLHGLDATCCEKSLHVPNQPAAQSKRHSAPNIATAPPRNDSYYSCDMLPVILEERDKTRSSSDQTKLTSPDSTAACSDITVREVDIGNNSTKTSSPVTPKSLTTKRTTN